MPGIYFHIPFCKKACHYCNFHFSTQLKDKEAMVDALERETALRRPEFENLGLDSLYFGGGTPSVLEIKDLERLMLPFEKQLRPDAEITLEANPDDLTEDYTSDLKSLGINRLSIGVQSFFDEDLAYMNRSHSSKEIYAAMESVHRAGFDHFSLDLIYGGHTTSDERWEENILRAIDLGPRHISSYCMTIEEQTVFGHWLKAKKLEAVDEEKANRQYAVLRKKLAAAGFEHYEISNFALPGFRAVHNSNYWKGHSYLGFGPGAHSYISPVRSWNVSNNARYIRSIEEGLLPSESETLTQSDQFNEAVMVGLRTSEGLDLTEMALRFGRSAIDEVLAAANEDWMAGKIKLEKNRMSLTEQGLDFCDRISSQLFRHE